MWTWTANGCIAFGYFNRKESEHAFFKYLGMAVCVNSGSFLPREQIAAQYGTSQRHGGGVTTFMALERRPAGRYANHSDPRSPEKQES
jgi:hypothetical protein